MIDKKRIEEVKSRRFINNDNLMLSNDNKILTLIWKLN